MSNLSSLLTTPQANKLKFLVANHVSCQLHLAQSLRTGSKSEVLEADSDARIAAETYMQFVDNLLLDNTNKQS